MSFMKISALTTLRTRLLALTPLTLLFVSGCHLPASQIQNPDKHCYELYRLVLDRSYEVSVEIVHQTPVWFKNLARSCGNE